MSMKWVLIVLAALTFQSSAAIAEDDADKMMATFLNLKGHLCARVVNVSKLSIPNTYEVRCIEYRGGSGTVDYIVNLKSGEAFRR